MLSCRRGLRVSPARSHGCTPAPPAPSLRTPRTPRRAASPAPAPPGLTFRLLCAETKKMATVNIYKDVIQTLFDRRG